MTNQTTVVTAAGSRVPVDPRCRWHTWGDDSSRELAELVEAFEPIDHPAGHAASAWLRKEARHDIFTATQLLASDTRIEGFITCRVSEATLTRSGVRSLGAPHEARRKQVPAYLLCWCAKHRRAEIAGEELVLNAIRLGREVREYGCAILALDPHDEACAEKVWRKKHGFREGTVPGQPENRRLWMPLSAT